MQTIQLIHDNKLTEYLVNHDHKLILRILDTAKDDNCDVQIHHTNYPELKVIIGEEIPAIDTLQTQIDMDLELRISKEYLMLPDQGVADVEIKTDASPFLYIGP